MAHNLMNDSAYMGRQSAWHNLGTVTGSYFSWAEILKNGMLDFTVTKEQLSDSRGSMIDAYATFRNDPSGSIEFLGTVGKDYTVVQHKTGFEMIDRLVASKDGAHYETCGALGKGEVVWGLADLKFSVNVGKDENKAYLLFSTSHDGSGSYSFRTCLTRVVCANTLSVAMSEKTSAQFSIRHTKHAANRIADAHSTLDMIQGDMKTISERLNFLANRRMDRENMTAILDRLFPKTKGKDEAKESSTRRDNILADVLRIYEANDGDVFPEQRGSAYNLLQAITGFVDHERSSKGDMRSQSALFGSGDVLKSKALEIITAVSGSLAPVPMRQTFATTSQVVSTGSLLDDIMNATTHA